MTWIKICGTTSLDDALLAGDAGADALGFVFYDQSPRNISLKAAGRIVNELPATIEKVGVFVNQTEDQICAVADRVALSAIQLHGQEENPQVAELVARRRPDLKIIVGVSMHRPSPNDWAMTWNPAMVHAFLLDSGTPTKPGGTGTTFDWEASRHSVDAIARHGHVVVAGGLNPANVSHAIHILKPWGVDVVSGVEASLGKKDPAKVRAFVTAVRRATDSTWHMDD